MIGMTLGVAFLLSLMVTAWIAGPLAPFRLLDRPNERSLHERPMPRGGGLGVVAGAGVAWAVVAGMEGVPPALMWTGGAALVVAAVSFLDDVRGLSPLVRFAVQGGAAVVLVWQGLWPERLPLPGGEWAWPAALGAAFAWLFAVWMTNLYNFMDGMDGFAGGMAVFGFGALALLGWLAGDLRFALLCGSVAAAAAGFLAFNFPPARIFMGDVGSSALGFLAASMILWADRRGLFPLWIGVLVFSTFVVDATVTLVRRLLCGETPWRAHRLHCYQRLARSGWGHRKTVLWEYALMLACAASAVLAVKAGPAVQWMVILAWAGTYVAILFAVERVAPFGSSRRSSMEGSGT